MTRGVDLNNPMNLMERPDINWLGEIKPTADPFHRLCQFSTMLDGLRAGAKNLKNQQWLHGLATWDAIIPKYAPRSENDTVAYINAMVAGTGVGADYCVDLLDAGFLSLSVGTVVRHEQGFDACSQELINQAVQEALEV